MELSADGDFALSSQTSIIAGTFSVENDLLCTQSTATLLGRKFCAPVYRNPGGSRENGDEYAWPDSVTVLYFSPAR